jgi:2-dehydro-3-deoxyphosphogluconate aldolase/(4S)-4-hydroxy-2-oxoglutarate aldolase
LNKTQQIADAIIKQGMLPLYFNSSEEVSLDVLKAIYRAGVKAVEYTNRGDAALANFKKMVALRNAEMPGLLLGVGTIKNMQHATDYMAAGADFFSESGIRS